MRARHIAVALAVSGLVIAAFAAPAHAAYPGHNGMLAYNSGFAAGIWTMNPDGTGQTQLTTGRDGEPAWSPDGRRIAYRRCASATFSCASLRVIDADGANDALVYEAPSGAGSVLSPTWSPDGLRIAFAIGADIWTVGVDGSGAVPITQTPESESRPNWSPKGDEIAFGANGAIYAVRPDGTGRRTIVPRPPPDPDFPDGLPTLSSPDWAPDGEGLLYLQVDWCGESAEPMASIVTVRADGTGRAVVAPGCFPSYADPAWSPDGERIVYWTTGDGDINPIAQRRLDGSGFVNTGVIGTRPDWQPLNRAPQCDGITASPARLRPVNRHFRAVAVAGGSDPDGDPLTLEITAVTQDEPVRGSGDGTTPDARAGSAPDEVRLRAERSPRGDGRVYHLTVQASDGRRGTCEGEATVEVRRHPKRAAVDSAPPRFDSFG